MNRLLFIMGLILPLVFLAGCRSQSTDAPPPKAETKVSQTSRIQTLDDWEEKASDWVLKNLSEFHAAHPEKIAAARKLLPRRESLPISPEIRKANLARGFVYFHRNYQQFIPTHAALDPSEVNPSEVSLSLARNEWESLQLGILPLADITRFKVVVSDLLKIDGPGILDSTENIRVYYGQTSLHPLIEKIQAPDDDITLKGGGKPTSIVTGYEQPPFLLLRRKELELKNLEAQAIWLDVRAPKTIAPGIYRGEIKFVEKGEETHRLPFQVTIHPFLLEPADDWSRGAFIPRLCTREELIQMKENGLNMVSWWTSAGYTLELKDGKIAANFSPFQEYLSLLDEVGYKGPHTVFLGASDPKIENRILELLGRKPILNGRAEAGREQFEKADLSPPFPEYLCEALRQFYQQMRVVGHSDLTVCLLDEPDHEPNPQRRDFYNKIIAMVEKDVPELPLYGVFYHEGDEDRLSHHHHVWCSNRPAARLSTMARGAGKHFWTYSGGIKFFHPAERSRFRLGILPWVYQADGSLFWGNFWHEDIPFTNLEASLPSLVSIPTPEGPLQTAVLKGIREGVDDRRYLATLEKMIRKARESSNESLKATAETHQQFLDQFRKPLFDKWIVRGGEPDFKEVKPHEIRGMEGSVFAITPESKNTSELADFIRADVTRRLLSLQKLMGENQASKP